MHAWDTSTLCSPRKHWQGQARATGTDAWFFEACDDDAVARPILRAVQHVSVKVSHDASNAVLSGV